MTAGRRRLGHPTGPNELIVYATPIGPLAATIDRYGATVSADLTPTTAQTYPPHCTLTGFFHRDDRGVAQVISEIGAAVDAAGPVPPGAVQVVGLAITDRWVGLELRSTWLIDLTARIAAGHVTPPGGDGLRLKDRLHLSLAYGAVDDVGPHAALACDTIDSGEPVDWEVALWERHFDGSWTRHTTPPRRSRPSTTTTPEPSSPT